METSKEMGSDIAATGVEERRFGRPGVLQLAIALASGAALLSSASHANGWRDSWTASGASRDTASTV